MIDFMGADHIMWGSDYPHEEGLHPALQAGHPVGAT